MLDPRPRFGFAPRFIAAALVVLACATAASASFAIGTIDQITADLAAGGKPIKSPALIPATDGAPQTILIVGDDHTGNTAEKAIGTIDQGTGVPLLHADTFMLVRMDPQQGQTSILSIPRDLMISFCYPQHSSNCYSNVKFNEAYAVGGVTGVLQVIKQYLPGVTVNHVIDFNFSSFIGVIDAIGCVYIDVDQSYINTTNDTYLAIHLAPGYHRLCGNSALAYVRYRHTDSDFVRVARQADFIRQAKEQLGVGALIGKYNQILSAFGKAIHTDIHTYDATYQLLQLAAASLSTPVRHVPFQADNVSDLVGGQDFVTSTPQLIQASINNFLYEDPKAEAPPAAPPTPTRALHRHPHNALLSATSLAAHDFYALSSGTVSDATIMSVHVPFAVYIPSVQTGTAIPMNFHAYRVYDEQGYLHDGYRIDWSVNGDGGYYGIEGVAWSNPPLFAHPTATETINGRTYMFVDNGGAYQYIGWREGDVLYWVSNSLLDDLSNKQMLTLAESAHPIR